MEELIGLLLVPTFYLGIVVGIHWNDDDEIRNKVVLYCIEKPELCKEEYNNIKTQENLNNYKRPELGETK